MNRRISIKNRLLASVIVLVSVIVVGLTTVTYYQYHQSQIKKIISQADAIILPFHDVIRQELPIESQHMELYLSVALKAKGSSQLPLLLSTYEALQGICFYKVSGKRLLCHGDVRNGQLFKNEYHFSGKQIQVLVPFMLKGHQVASSLLAFSSAEFEKEKTKILINGSLSLVLFLAIGILGASWVGRSIATPIERLARHIKLNELDDIPLQERGDEIGDFSRTINELAATLSKREAELEHMAYFDALTGLPNRSLFMDRLDQMMRLAGRESATLAVLFIDLNDFKYINDTFGHDAGDKILVQVAERMEKAKRRSDTLAHISGDEFNLALYNPGHADNIAEYCESLLEVLDAPFDITQKAIYVSASIGVTLFSGEHDSDSAETLIKNADRAMYHAKRFGGNQYRFYNEYMHQHNKDREALEAALRRAVEDGDIEMHYQPKLYLRDNRLSGIEALARWHHPELGQIPPNKFISLAEEIGLIGVLGRNVMRMACQQMQKWLELGLDDVTMAINLSPQQFSDPDLLSTIEQTLAETGLSTKNLEFEITESAAMSQPEQVISILSAINEMGISVALDDFGTGHSSLSRLNQFPLSTLKIDRSFIQDLSTNEDNVSLVRGITSMAKAMNMKTVAEGVEQQPQAEILLNLGVQQVQGYYFSRPLSATQFEEYAGLLRSNATDELN